MYGFFIRKKTRDLIYAQANIIIIAMNKEEEARAIKEALRFSAMNSLQDMVIKTDSLTLNNLIRQTRKVS